MKNRPFRHPIDAWQPFGSLHGFVRLILLVDWDPIGILGEMNAMDEYDSYASGVCQLLRSGASRERLVKHLDEIERINMGLSERSRKTHNLDPVAGKLLDVYHTLSKRDNLGAEE